ncbi:hypothetical protein RJ640_000960 [Escallonia rubra]|uniref:Reverse transcriptase zinc-binding domain-containing protein n=1 Tax=Escallonia rubra TaxID=112253 RepID=A0AA88UNG1_9ASTE|nr:hypothetical protein RJ640_000960 [Escallonia rubra]
MDPLYLQQFQVTQSSDELVANYIKNGTWNESLLRNIFPDHVTEHILDIFVSQGGCPDKVIWTANPTGIFSVSSAYNLQYAHKHLDISIPSDSSTVWKNLWALQVPPKLLYFLWQLLWDRLPLLSSLSRKGILLWIERNLEAGPKV